MKSLLPFSFQNVLLLISSSLLASIMGFGIAYQQDSARFKDLGMIAWAHLTYAEEMKDDMAVIDWSKNLEKLDIVKAFKFSLGSKKVAEGGNLNFLPATVSEGAAFLFPSDWSFRILSSKDPQEVASLTIVFHSWPGPFFWSIFLFSACLICGGVSAFFSAASRATPSKTNITSTNRNNDSTVTASPIRPAMEPQSAPLIKNAPYLFFDKNYVILKVAPEAAGYFKKKPEDLLNGHLLELSPDSALIQAFEKAEEAKISKPFPDHPHIQATLKPDPNGCLLILETTQEINPL
jgi:hypothetical protein